MSTARGRGRVVMESDDKVVWRRFEEGRKELKRIRCAHGHAGEAEERNRLIPSRQLRFQDRVGADDLGVLRVGVGNDISSPEQDGSDVYIQSLSGTTILLPAWIKRRLESCIAMAVSLFPS